MSDRSDRRRSRSRSRDRRDDKDRSSHTTNSSSRRASRSRSPAAARSSTASSSSSSSSSKRKRSRTRSRSRERTKSSHSSSRHDDTSRRNSRSRDTGTHDSNDEKDSKKKKKKDHRSDDKDEKKKKKKSHSSHSSSSKDKKKKKKDKKDGSDDEERKKVKEAKKLLKSLTNVKPVTSRGAISVSDAAIINKRTNIHEVDDYFQRSAEFRVWLHREQNKAMDELPSEVSRQLFKAFARLWNDGLLDVSYYKGINATSVDSRELTKHKWKFKLSDKERFQMETTRDTVDTLSKSNANEAFDIRRAAPAAAAAAESSSSSGRPIVGPAGPPSRNDDTLSREADRKAHRAEVKAYSKHNEMVMEELVPKATGREAMIEKMKAANAFHKRDDDTLGDMAESDLMGSSGTSEYQRLLAQRQQRTARIEDAKAKKVEEYRAKEAERMRLFKQQMGLGDKFNTGETLDPSASAPGLR